MAVMMRDLYSALKESGVSETSALKAAEEVAEFTRQLNDTKGEFANVRNEFANVRAEFAAMKGEMLTVKALLGLIAAGVVALVVKTFFH